MQYNAAQHWQYSTILGVNAISNSGTIIEMVHPDSFGDDGGKNPHDSDSENW